MSEQVIWLVAFLALYAAFLLYWGAATGRGAADAKTFFLADRNLPAWIFVLTGTGASFSGWVFLGHPDMVFQSGFPFAQVALCAVTVPLAGLLFLKRQWMLGKRYGFVTPAEMLGAYYGGELIRLLVVVIALVFAVPFVGMQLGAAGSLIAYLSGGAIDRTVAMWTTTIVVFACVCFGGLRAAAFVGTLQALLLGAGAIAIAGLVLRQLGGLTAFNAALAQLGAPAPAATGQAAAAPLPLFAIPGVIQFTAGLGVQAPAGGAWTTAMILTYCLALMSLQLAPGFTMLAFATRSPKGFSAQQTWASAGVVGAILVVFPIVAGFGERILHGAGQATVALPADGAGVVASLVAALGEGAPWFLGLLAVCALAAVQGITALQLSAASTMLVRDVYRRYFAPHLDVLGQRRYARITIGLIALVALLLATFAPRAQAMLGALALGFGFQLLPALTGLCWLPWITREAATVGLAIGLAAVVMTDTFGLALAHFAGIHLPWGRWPWTIHSAGWGIACNVAACIVVSLISQRHEEGERRRAYHAFLTSYASLPTEKRYLRPLGWAATLAWLLFAIGPGALYGNDVFGKASGGLAAWNFGMPSIWIWQIAWWALGVLLIWFLAYRLALSSRPARMIEPLPRSQRPKRSTAALPPEGARRWFWIVVLAAGFAVLVNWVFG